MVVRRVLVDTIPYGFSPPMGQQAHFDPPIPKLDMDAEVAPTVPDAQSAPNMLVGDACQTHDIVADPSHEIPLIQNHPSVLYAWLLEAYHIPYIQFFILSSFFYLCCSRHT